jgi:formate dehydrogenase iron-sulfur subunit
LPTSRRTFLKLALAGSSVALLQQASVSQKTFAASSESSPDVKRKGALYDATKCVGCRACQNACKQWNHMPADPTGYDGIYDNPFHLSAKTLTLIKYKETENSAGKNIAFCKYQCMHCEHPACAEACFVGAFTKTPDGPVVYNDKRCIGCRYCMVACPFGIPTFEWDDPLPWIKKCTFCADRQEQGLEPACIAACPTRALKFGDRKELIVEAKKRIETEPSRYINHIYGETEAGGTSWIYLSAVPFTELGFPSLDSTPVTTNLRRAVGAVPPVLVVMAAAMTGIYTFMKRKRKLKEAETEIVSKP